jgi:hypothetical protein
LKFPSRRIWLLKRPEFRVVVKAVLLQELEGIVPRADGLELEAVQVFVVIIQKRIE